MPPIYPDYQSFIQQDKNYYLHDRYQTPVKSTSEVLSSTVKFAASLGIAHSIGISSFGKKRGYDYIVSGIRAIEEYSPAKILRTFQLSHMLSPFETAARQTRYFHPDVLSRLSQVPAGRAWLSYVSDLTGKDIFSGNVLSEGFRFEGGQLLTGRTGGDILLRHASIIRNLTAAEPRFQSAYARSLVGGPYPQARSIFMERIPFETASGKMTNEIFSFVGGQTRREAAGRYISGYGTSLIERLNQLARSPFELPVVKDLFNKLPKFLRPDVIPSSGLRTLGKLSLQMGLGLSIGILGYQELDYLTRQSSLFDPTIFSEGITAGLAGIWANTQIGISEAADFLGLHSFREGQEEIAPGSTSLQKLLAFPIIGGLGGIGLGYAHRVFSQIGLQFSKGMSASSASVAYSGAQELFLKRIGAEKYSEELISAVPSSSMRFLEQNALEMSEGYLGRLASKIVSSSETNTVLGRILKRTIAARPTFGRLLGTAGLALGALAVAPFLPGALIPSDRPEELEALYSGEKEVPVRKGRLWEFGRSSFEGGRITRYEPHLVNRLQNRWTDIGIYGEQELSPLEKWYKRTFTYDIEKQNYYSRPYPVSSPAFSEIPLVGPLLGATIGKLVKPPVLMHENIWRGSPTGPATEASRINMAQQNMSYLAMPLRYGERRPIPELGEVPEGIPISPFGWKGVSGEQIYRMTEAIGLPGFTMTSIKEAITGRQDIFDEEMQLASAGDIYSSGRSFWDAELGGGLGSTELVRRLFPHKRRQIPLYNPIPNQMPEWLPGEGDKSINFRVGDPYAQIPHGEWRLPGPGYEARFPELKGLTGDQYPDVWKLKILADVAEYSDKYKEMELRVRSQKKAGELSDRELQIYQEIQEQVKAKKVRREFTPYKYRDRALNPSEVALARANEEAKQEPGPSFFERAFGKYWEFLGHNVETPLEFLTPVSPGAKLVHMRTAVEDYKKEQLYGTSRAFWQHPVRDFLKPLLYSSLHSFGWGGVPGEVEQKREIENYFDVLKYVKFTRLKQQALEEGDKTLAGEFEEKRRETLFGINPYGYIYTHIFRALPRSDRDYFNEFVKADAEEREEIMNIIPENEKALFTARWKLEDAINWRKAIKKGLLPEEEMERAKKEIADVYNKRNTEGFPIDDELFDEFIHSRMQGESYADWYRRKIRLPNELAGKVLPGPDWCGFSPSVDLEDVKLKVVQNIGGDPFMYDIWPDQVRAAAGRPYLEGAAEALEGNMTTDEIKKRVESILAQNGMEVKNITMKPIYRDNSNHVNLLIKEDRSADIRVILKGEED